MAHILIAEDDPATLDLLCELASDAGHTTMCAPNGREALEMARQCTPALIISDVGMPIMDGYALLKAVRTDLTLAHTIVILISANVEAMYTLKDTTTAFMPKPLDLKMLDRFLHNVQ